MEIILEIPKDINKVCRTCLNVAVADEGIFYHRLIQNSQSTDISKFFESVTSLKIVFGDGLPELICNDCYDTLVEFYAYKNRCRNSEKKLKVLLEKCTTSALKEDIESVTKTIETVNSTTDSSFTMTDRENLYFECQDCDSIFMSYYQLNRHRFRHNATKTLSQRLLENCIQEEQINSTFNETEVLQLIKIRKSSYNNNEKDVKESPQTSITNNTKRTFVIKVHCSNCKVCRRKFTSVEDLRTHVCEPSNLNSEAVNDFSKSCSICNKLFSDPSALSLHFLKHVESIESKYLFCEVCGQLFDCITNLDQHYNKKHTGKMYWTCSECQATFNTEMELLKHKLVHPLLTHMPSGTNFPCILCKKNFSSIVDLLDHIPIHVTMKYNCRRCKLSFCTEESNYAHLKSHPGAIHTCSICRKTLHSKYYLKLHIKTVHFPTEVHKCETCGKGFKTLDRLKVHCKIHRILNNYICSYCGFGSKYSGDHQIHMRSHTKEKPYKCTFVNCKSSFTTSTHLRTHIRQHLNLRPYKCSFCSADFTTCSTLKKHLMLHTGEQPYSCPICQKKVRRRYHLKVHMKQHSNI